MTRTMQGVEDFLRLDIVAAAGIGDNGGAGVADCVDDTVVFGCCCCWCWLRTTACRFLRGPYWGGSELMVVDTGKWVEVESPACKREGVKRLTAPAQDRLCSGVSRSLAVSATDLGVMGGHHRQQWRSSCVETNRERENYMLILFVFSELRCSHLGKR